MTAYDLPPNIRETLTSGFFAAEADWAIKSGAKRGQFDHAGDPVGKIIAWLWRNNQDDAMMGLADYISQLRNHHPAAPSPPITLDDVLGALRPAMPSNFIDYELLCAKARTDVPVYYGSPAA